MSALLEWQEAWKESWEHRDELSWHPGHPGQAGILLAEMGGKNNSSKAVVMVWWELS